MAFEWITAPIEINSYLTKNQWDTLTWTDITEISAVPDGVTGAIVYWTGGDADAYGWQWRMVGGVVAALNTEVDSDAHNWAVVGIDSNGQTDFYLDHDSEKLYIMGWVSGFTGLDTQLLFDSDTVDEWNDHDLSAQCPAATAIAFAVDDNTGWFWRIRRNGSANDVQGPSFLIHGVVACDSGQGIEFYPVGFGGVLKQKLGIAGYFTSGVTFQTNATEITPSSYGAWVSYDLSGLLTAGTHNTAFFQMISSGTTKEWGLRKVGSSRTHKAYTTQQGFGIVEVDSGGSIEIYLRDSGVELYFLGSGTAGVAVSPTESLTRVTGIRHVYRPGFFRMLVSLGDVSNTIEIAEDKVRKELEIPEEQTPKEAKPPKEPVPTTMEKLMLTPVEPIEILGASAKVTAPEPIPDMPILLESELLPKVEPAKPPPPVNLCPYPGCDEAFLTQTELLVHIRQKHGGM